MKNIIAHFASLAALLLPLSSQANITINRTGIVLQMAPGAQSTEVLTVSNAGKVPKLVTIFASDWVQDEKGAVDAVAPDSLPRSISKWFGVNPSQFELGPGQSKEVSINVAVPAGAKLDGGDYTAMIFTQTDNVLPNQKDKSGREVQLKIISRLGTKVILRAPNTEVKPAAEIDGMKLVTEQEKPTLQVTVANTGKHFFQSEKSFVQIQDAKGEIVEKVRIPVFSCLPGNKRLLSVKLPLQSGKKYTLLAMIDYGAPEILAGELEATVR